MSGETESKTSTTSAKEEERKERIIKLKRKIKSDAEIIEQIKDDISKMDDNTEEGEVLKKTVTKTLGALVEELNTNKAEEQYLELMQHEKEGALGGFDEKLLRNLKTSLGKRGGKRKTKRKIRTRRKKRTKRRRTRRRRSKKRRTRRRRKRRRGGTLDNAHGPTKMAR